MHWEPDVGFDPGSPGSRPGPKAGAKPLRHPGIPRLIYLLRERQREGQRDRESGGEGQRERRERESQADSPLSTEPDAGLDLMTLRS